jgi:hypothetical protein
VLLTRSPLEHPQRGLSARLACVKHAASVRPEPGSNSPKKTIKSTIQAKPKNQDTTQPTRAMPQQGQKNIDKRHTVEFSKIRPAYRTRTTPPDAARGNHQGMCWAGCSSLDRPPSASDSLPARPVEQYVRGERESNRGHPPAGASFVSTAGRDLEQPVEHRTDRRTPGDLAPGERVDRARGRGLQRHRDHSVL